MAAAVALCLLLILTPPTTTTASAPRVHADQTNGGCIASERAVLLSFRAGVTSDPGNLLASWEGRDCCRWSGVRCSRRSGHVVQLDLRNAHFLGGEISSSLLALRKLKYLDLSGNDLSGAGGRMPEFLGSLKSLTYLNLSNVCLHGRIPPQLGNLSNLLYLDLNSASCPNAIYSTDISWLSRLSSLRHLDMSGSGLGKAFDWVDVVNMLPYLRVLRLSGCGIRSSTAPLLRHNLTALELLDLSRNEIANRAALNWFWKLTSLKHLNLTGCGLYGSLPSELGSMTSLQVLSLEDNDIEGMIPPTLQKMSNLKALDLSFNKIGADIAGFMEKLPQCARFQELRLSGARMFGTLPTWVENLTSLHILDLSGNQLTGLVPLGIRALTNLTLLDLSYNNLSGVVSEDHLDSLVSLEFIALSYNFLRVALDSDWVAPFRLKCAHFASCQMGLRFPTWLRWHKDLVSIDISDAGIIDTIPNWFWTVSSHAIDVNISHNQISGVLPTDMEPMSIERLLLYSNRLTGPVPPKSLELLDISGNSLCGPLPSNFGAPQLGALILFSNNITGSVPPSICELQQLGVLNLSHNHLAGELPACGNRRLGIFALLLGNNSLSGEFPLFLQSCKNLASLNLASNRFYGRLPAWIGDQLSSLQILRLRSNMFCGFIPFQIMELEALRYLDLA